MFCKNCGNELPDGSVFCSKCGQNVNGATAPTQAQQFADPKMQKTRRGCLISSCIAIGIIIIFIVIIIAAIVTSDDDVKSDPIMNGSGTTSIGDRGYIEAPCAYEELSDEDIIEMIDKYTSSEYKKYNYITINFDDGMGFLIRPSVKAIDYGKIGPDGVMEDLKYMMYVGNDGNLIRREAN